MSTNSKEELRRAVALGMPAHPKIRAAHGGYVVEIPPWREVLETADRLLEQLDAAGYAVTRKDTA